MKRWYPRVFSAGDDQDADLMLALDAADAYEDLYEVARKDLIVDGRLEHMQSRVPGIAEQRWAQIQDLEAILEYLENKERKAHVNRTRHYLEHYNRALNERTAKDYAETHEDVQKIRVVRHRIAYVRNLWLGVWKGIEYMHYQIGNVTKLRAAGLEDAVLDLRRYD